MNSVGGIKTTYCYVERMEYLKKLMIRKLFIFFYRNNFQTIIQLPILLTKYTTN